MIVQAHAVTVMADTRPVLLGCARFWTRGLARAGIGHMAVSYDGRDRRRDSEIVL